MLFRRKHFESGSLKDLSDSYSHPSPLNIDKERKEMHLEKRDGDGHQMALATMLLSKLIDNRMIYRNGSDTYTLPLLTYLHMHFFEKVVV